MDDWPLTPNTPRRPPGPARTRCWGSCASCTIGRARPGSSSWTSFRSSWTSSGASTSSLAVIFPSYPPRVLFFTRPSITYHTAYVRERKSYGRNIYKVLLGISLLLAINFSLCSVYMTAVLRNPAPYAYPLSVVRRTARHPSTHDWPWHRPNWRDQHYTHGMQVWRALVFLNSLPIVFQEAWQCRTEVGWVTHTAPLSAPHPHLAPTVLQPKTKGLSCLRQRPLQRARYPDAQPPVRVAGGQLQPSPSPPLVLPAVG